MKYVESVKASLLIFILYHKFSGGTGRGLEILSLGIVILSRNTIELNQKAVTMEVNRKVARSFSV